MAERIALFTQEKNIYAKDRPVSKPLDLLTNAARDISFGSIPHLGAGIIASESRNLGYEVDYHPISSLDNIDWEGFSEVYELIMISAIDRGVSGVVERLENGLLPRGRTVLGGQGITPIASQLSKRFGDVAIVEGRGEGQVSQLLQDFRLNGEIGGLYANQNGGIENFGEHPSMDPNLSFRNDEIFYRPRLKPIELTTGCTQNCEFCPIAKEQVTRKPLDVAIREIEMMSLNRGDMMIVVDHNILNLPRNYLRDFFDYVNSKGISWAGEGTISQVVDSPDLLIKMAENCISFLAGLEDIKSGYEGSPAKQRLTNDFAYILQTVRKVGLPITWSMVFPLDTQSRESYLDTAAFIKQHKLDINSHLLQPRYGTKLHDQVAAEGRLNSDDSRLRDGVHLVYEPGGMTREEALSGAIWIKGKVNSPTWLAERLSNNLRYLGEKKAAALAAIELSSDYMTYLRMSQMYPELKKEVRRYEEDWNKRSY